MRNQIRSAASMLILLFVAACTGTPPIVNPDWCYTFDFTQSSFGISPVSGTWNAGDGFRSSGGTLNLTYTHTSVVQPSYVQALVFVDNAGATVTFNVTANIFGISINYADTAANLLSSYIVGENATSPNQFSNSATISANSTVPIAIRSLRVEGLGPNPFNRNDCPREATQTPTPQGLPTLIPTYTPLPSSTPTATATPTNTPIGPSPTPTVGKILRWNANDYLALASQDIPRVIDINPNVAAEYPLIDPAQPQAILNNHAVYPGYIGYGVRVGGNTNAFYSTEMTLELVSDFAITNASFAFIPSHDPFTGNNTRRFFIEFRHNGTVTYTEETTPIFRAAGAPNYWEQRTINFGQTTPIIADEIFVRFYYTSAFRGGYLKLFDVDGYTLQSGGTGTGTPTPSVTPTAAPTDGPPPTSPPPTATPTYEEFCTFVNPSFNQGLTGWTTTGSRATGSVVMADGDTISQSVPLTGGSGYFLIVRAKIDDYGSSQTDGLVGFDFVLTLPDTSTDPDTLTAVSEADFTRNNNEIRYVLPITPVLSGSHGFQLTADLTNVNSIQITEICLSPVNPDDLESENADNDGYGWKQCGDQISSPTSILEIGGWIQFLWSNLDQTVQCTIMPPINNILNTVIAFFGWTWQTAIGFFEWTSGVVLPFISGHLSNLFQALLQLVSQGFSGFINLLENVFNQILIVRDVVSAAGDLVSGYVGVARAYINLGTVQIGNVVTAYQQAPATAPAFMPFDCVVSPLDDDICAVYYVAENTVLAGPLGGLIIPFLTIIIDVVVLMYFSNSVRKFIRWLLEMIRT